MGGNVQLVQGATADLDANRVTRRHQLFAHRGAQSMTRDRVNGNLRCKENSTPTVAGNIVHGNKEDQWARL